MPFPPLPRGTSYHFLEGCLEIIAFCVPALFSYRLDSIICIGEQMLGEANTLLAGELCQANSVHPFKYFFKPGGIDSKLHSKFRRGCIYRQIGQYKFMDFLGNGFVGRNIMNCHAVKVQGKKENELI